MRQSVALPGEMTVEFDSSSRDEKDGTVRMKGNVVARYDLTTVRCDEMVLTPGEHKGRVVGEAKLDDPEGNVACRDLEFNWKDKTGSAQAVTLIAGGVRIAADSLTITPKKWVIRKAVGTVSRLKHPPYRFWAETVDLVPGDQGTAHRVFLEFFGKKFGPLANVDFNLDRRVTGFKMPNLTNKRGAGFGVAWDSSVLLTDKSSLGATINMFPRLSPEYLFQYSYSPLDPNSSPFSIAPRSELTEYFGDGWFDSIVIKTPEEETETIGQQRKAVGVSVRVNQDTFARNPDALNVTQPLDLAVEAGGTHRGWGYLGTGHLQRVREDREDPWVDRLVFQGTLKPPSLQLGRLSFSSRLDAVTTTSNRGLFAFGRVETGLVYSPLEGVNIGAGVGFGASAGEPDFAFDRVPYDKSLLGRVDYRRGPFTVRFLWKWDLETRRLYDREYELALVADGFEPFITSRSFPSDFRVGVRFRLDALTDHLSKRQVKRRDSDTPETQVR
ncbi:MAG: hypothetical protein KF857_06890 [Fimbriimonadaceae bacterium]|nr:hypothetical protein [Fimbriimonadaceae bacterium]